MDLQQELLTSTLWIAKAYGYSAVAFVLVCRVVVRRTSWGRQFWALSGAYFASKRSVLPLLGLAFILLLTLAGVRLGVLFSNWSNGMYTSLQKLDAGGFWRFMWIFCILASVHVLRALLEFYVNQHFVIHWRIWLNEHLLSRLLNQQAYYRHQFLAQPIENPDQRIQQDVGDFARQSLDLSMGVVSALVSIVAYTVVLWGLSGELEAFGVILPRAMVFIVFAYVLIATLFAVLIGRPLVRLNFLNELFNANYRYALVRLREYAESIAFYAGEQVEGRLLRSRFAEVIKNAWAIVFRSLKFQGFNLIVNQTAVVFPFLIQASRFFKEQITLGDLMQTARAFGELHSNLSFFRSAYDDFAKYRAVLNRLDDLQRGVNEALDLPRPQTVFDEQRLALQDFSLRSPNGDLLIDALNLEIPAGSALLVQGRSGGGKTTLLRSLAGLWPYSSGYITRPEHSVLFLSQRPYLPQGSLRDALCYPNNSENYSEDAVCAVLRAVQLAPLSAQLDVEQDWGHVLSLGEQQRLAFGRLLLNAPRIAFLDEASSALDEGLEDAMYRLVREQLPHTTLLSVGHRSSLRQYHAQQLQLLGEGKWLLQ